VETGDPGAHIQTQRVGQCPESAYRVDSAPDRSRVDLDVTWLLNGLPAIG
jgi:hypothetical protein